MKPPTLFAVVALDGYGEQCFLSTHTSQHEAELAQWRLRNATEAGNGPAKATTYHVAVFGGEWVEP